MAYYVGIDLGGTNIKAGLVRNDGIRPEIVLKKSSYLYGMKKTMQQKESVV